MKFLLDHDVDAHVRRAFTSGGHDCWTAAEANLWAARDDDLTVYAFDHDAVLVTHDVEFSKRRSRNVIGHHLHLRCPEEDAEQLVVDHLGEVVAVFEIRSDIFVRLSIDDGIMVHWRWK